ncbi:MAG: DUF1214 domain-containing protein [Aestuariivirga sp.]|uniref:DUF1214 domain-containing protein n=1 Tax=Aestuariivirga sp. TaxID=2650926 RepID=UPI0038D10FD6
MRRFIWASTYAAGGLAAGCLSAFLMINNAGVKQVAAGGPWQSREAALSGPQGFYARAHYMLAGRAPPAPGQVIEATAGADDDGQPLRASCTYRLTAKGPLPAWWSLTALAGGAASSSLQATAGSGSAIGAPDGSLSITASGLPVPGNWLRLPQQRQISLLYTALSPQPAVSAPPFAIRREGCS